jgi:hypothetical protein
MTKAPYVTAACHCRGCQRMSSSAYSLTAILPADGLEVTAGEPVIGGVQGATRHYFCPSCMSWMFTRPEGADQIVNLRPTMLDDANWFAPFMETQTAEKLPWAVTGAVHSFVRFPPMEAYAGLMQDYAVSVGR